MDVERRQTMPWSKGLRVSLGFGLLWLSTAALFGQDVDVVASTLGEASSQPFGGYVETTDTGGLETRSAALILSGQEGGDVPVSVVAMPHRSLDGGAAQGLDLWTTLSGLHLTAAWPDDDDLLVEVYAYALDGQNGVASYLSRAFHLRTTDHRKALAAAQDLHFAGRLALPSGEYSLRVLVLLRQSGRLGMRVKQVVVPGAAGTMGPPPLQALFLAPVQGFLAMAEDAGRPELFTVGDAPWAPREWPDLAAVTALHVDLPPRPPGPRANGGAPGPAAGPSAMAISLQSQNGQQLRQATVVPRPETTITAPSRNLQRLELEPFDIPAGQYLLSLRPLHDDPPAPGGRRRDAKGPPPRPHWVAVRLGHEETLPPAGRFESSSPVRAASSVGEPQPARQDRGGPARPGSRRQLSTAYRDALQQLANGQPRLALEAIGELERQAKGDGSGKRQAELMGTQLSVANFLASQRGDLLVPLMVLHDELYRGYRRRGDFFLATHSRKLVARLSELYDERSSADDVGRIRAEIFTSQAGFLLELGSILAAQNALSAALESHAEQPTALFLQATVAEYVGDYDGAVGFLRRLAKVEPLDGVGQLRLAINLRRLEKKGDEAHELLLQLVEREEDDWVTVVALQECASLLWSMGRQGEAQQILRSGLERFPEAHRLTIQLASMLDALGRPSQARQLLKNLTGAAPTQRATPRFLYSQWPLDRVRRVRRSLHRRQQQHLPALQETLNLGQSPRRAP